MRAFNRMLRGRVPSNQRPLASIIKGMFTNGEQGAWYDPSDLSTLYQDAAGTIPVTAVEQPVGLMLDKSEGLVQTDVTTLSTWAGPAIGGAAFNTQNVGLVKKVGTYYILSAEVSEYSGTGNVGFTGIDFGGSSVTARSNNGLIFAITQASSAIETRVYTRSTNTCKFTNISVRELPGNHASQITATSRPVLSARVNLLTKTEDFSHSDWGQQNNYAYESATDPEGGNTATKITSIGATATTSRALIATSATIDYTIYVKAGTHEPTVIFRNGTTSKNLIIAGSTNGSNTYGTWTITPIANGWKKVKVSVTSGVTAGNGINIYYGTGQVLAAGLYWYVWHPDLRPANIGTNLPDYQRVNTATDYDTAGFPRIERFDAVDDVQNITFPVSLGSNCTVARVAQGGAVTILTGQTIGTSYQINQSHAGLIVVNRALTQSETNAVTRYFQNKGSGK